MAFEKLAGRLIGKYVTAEGGGLKIDRARIVRGTLMAAAGWLFGRFGGKRRRSDDERNARNITQAQKK